MILGRNAIAKMVVGICFLDKIPVGDVKIVIPCFFLDFCAANNMAVVPLKV